MRAMRISAFAFPGHLSARQTPPLLSPPSFIPPPPFLSHGGSSVESFPIHLMMASSLHSRRQIQRYPSPPSWISRTRHLIHLRTPASRSATMGEESGKVTSLGIAKLKEMMQKWQSLALGPKEEEGLEEEEEQPEKPSGIPPLVEKRLKSLHIACDSDEEGCHSPEPPPDVPKGYFAVYVGEEQRRFVIPTSYLGQPVFKVLLEKVEEEFGFDHQGAITFPCEIETFKYILQFMERHRKGLTDDEGNPTDVEEE
ncbi:hypothetical protein Taro_019369 [Colocasia esculenta]|uniref:Uncharacterized protein n=1 Tax=Colocasia esculenta TaxID=4460 RepID=A0A843UZ23_COLES|nr:hypothetical protein [Colocasia esculenta]